MDSLNFSEISETVPNDKLEQLQVFVNNYKERQKAVETLEEALKTAKENFERVSRVHIPELLNSVGLSEVKLSTGEKIQVKDKLKASVADKNYLVAFNNMVKAEGGDKQAQEKVESLFKTRVVVEEVSDEVLELLIEQNIPYEVKRDIPWQTLNKYCQGKLDQGQLIPDGVSVFQYQETTIK